MKKNLGGAILTILAAATALVGLILRSVQLDGGDAVGLIVVSILMCILAFGLSLTLKRRGKYADVFTPCLADLILTAIGGVLLLAGCAITVFAAAAAAEKIIGAVGALGCLALLRGLMLRCQKKPVSAWYYVPVILYYVARLFLDFRRWSVDPLILDYCFALFASICFMMASYYAASFCFDRGGRRMLFSFSMLGTFFAGTALPGSSWQTLLCYGGSMAILLAYVWQSSKPKLRKREPKF